MVVRFLWNPLGDFRPIHLSNLRRCHRGWQWRRINGIGGLRTWCRRRDLRMDHHLIWKVKKIIQIVHNVFPQAHPNIKVSLSTGSGPLLVNLDHTLLSASPGRQEYKWGLHPGQSRNSEHIWLLTVLIQETHFYQMQTNNQSSFHHPNKKSKWAKHKGLSFIYEKYKRNTKTQE